MALGLGFRGRGDLDRQVLTAGAGWEAQPGLNVRLDHRDDLVFRQAGEERFERQQEIRHTLGEELEPVAADTANDDADQ